MGCREAQQGPSVVESFAADTGTGLGESVCVEHEGVAGPEMELGGHEPRSGDEADGVTADAIHVVGTAVGVQLQRRQMAAAAQLDVKAIAPPGTLP